MTACIVGWAHTPFGKLAGETVESSDRQGRERGARRRRNCGKGRRRDCARPLQCRLLGAGFHRLAGAAGLARPALQARHPRRERLCDRFRRRAPGTESDRRRHRAHRARRRRRADDDDARSGSRPQSAQGVLYPRGSRHRRRFCRDFRQDRRALFPALGRSVGCARPHCRQEPQERRRQSLRADPQGFRLRILPPGERQKPARRRAAQAHRLFAGFRRRRRAHSHRRRHRAEAQQGDRVPCRRACAGFPADVAARHSQIRGLRRGLEAGAGGRPASRCPICPSPRCTTASPSPN